jgi:hypothetical protein
MANIRGTEGRDVFTVGNGDFYEALGGDDEITLAAAWAGVDPGRGADRIVVTWERPLENNVMYWGRGPGYPAPVTVDLEAGFAIDGWGDRDTLVGVRSVHGAHHPGDRFLGSRLDDSFWVGSSWTNQTARVFVDGRGGSDVVSYVASPNSGPPVLTASADGRLVLLHYANFPNHVWELRNIERVNTTRDGNPGSPTNPFIETPVSALIDPSVVGAATLLGGNGKAWQAGALGTPVALTYGFLLGAPAYGGAEGGTGFTVLGFPQQQAVRDVFAKLAQQTGLVFTEVPGAQAQLAFGINQQSATRGYSFNPSEVADARAGDVWLDVETAAQLAPGQEGHYVLLHEIGHALGLTHPLPETDTSGRTVLLNQWADLRYTIMLENAPAPAAWPTWFSAFDLQALRALYGSKPTGAGNDRYQPGDAAGRQMSTILDDGGTDVLSAQGCTLGATIDLRPGRASSLGVTADGRAAMDNVVIGAGSWIEDAVGTPLDDVMTGNALGNRFWGAGGNDLIDGLEGVDWAVFDRAWADATVQRSAYSGQWTVAARDGTGGYAELRNLERLAFADRVLALDTGKTGAAGQAALLTGAVLGKALMQAKPDLLGNVLSLMDAGFTLPVLAGAVMNMTNFGDVWTVLAGGTSPQQIATYLHRTVNGTAPDAAQLAAAVSALTTQPAGAYLAGLATSAANEMQVGLAGLADTGLLVIPPTMPTPGA